MSVLKQRLQDDMKAAMKAGEKERLGVIRLILAAVKQWEVDERVSLDDEQIIAVLDKMVKQRRESIRQYRGGNRPDLADIEGAEIAVIQTYLPMALSEEEIDRLIGDAIAATGAAGISGMGKVMGVLKPRMQGRADMTAVSSRVKQLLGASTPAGCVGIPARWIEPVSRWPARSRRTSFKSCSRASTWST